jgi:hypothetical protein
MRSRGSWPSWQTIYSDSYWMVPTRFSGLTSLQLLLVAEEKTCRWIFSGRQVSTGGVKSSLTKAGSRKDAKGAKTEGHVSQTMVSLKDCSLCVLREKRAVPEVDALIQLNLRFPGSSDVKVLHLYLTGFPFSCFHQVLPRLGQVFHVGAFLARLCFHGFIYHCSSPLRFVSGNCRFKLSRIGTRHLSDSSVISESRPMADSRWARCLEFRVHRLLSGCPLRVRQTKSSPLLSTGSRLECILLTLRFGNTHLGIHFARFGAASLPARRCPRWCCTLRN